MKKWAALVMVLITVATLLAGCGPKEEEKAADGGEKKKVYFVSLKTGGIAWDAAKKGFEDAVEELGWDGQYVAPTTANDTSQMANLFETALTNKADGVLGVFYSKEVFGDIITRAREEGVVVGSVNVNLNGLEDFWIGTDQEGMGHAQAKALIEMADGQPAKVVYMVMNLGDEISQRAYKAFQEGIEGHENISLHGMENDENNPIVAADKMNNLVKQDPSINAVICLDNAGASLGVANFVEENGLQDSFYTVGIDASADILNYVKSGALDVTLDQDFYKMGYEGVYMLKKKFDGEDVPYANDSGMILVKQDEVDDYAKKKGLSLDD